MSFLPKASCPHCKGPVTFVQVMSIVTPFQSIDCTTCGTMLFLVHRAEIMVTALVTTILVIVGGVLAFSKGWVSGPVVYGGALICLVLTELIVTMVLVRKNALVIRNNN